MGRTSVMRFLVWLGFLVLGLGGCAGATLQLPAVDAGVAAAEAERQREIFVLDLLRANSQARTVYDPLIRANAGLCGNAAPVYLGATFFHAEQFPAEFQRAAGSILGNRDRVVIRDVFAGSPAAASGLRPGDAVLAVAGTDVRTTDEFGAVMQEQPGADGRIEFIILRDGAARSTSLRPEVACEYPLGILPGGELNAFADGNLVAISIGMLEFLRDENEIALVLGHELAHNMLLHVEKSQANAAAGALIGGILGALLGVDAIDVGIDVGAQIGAGAFSQDFEAEADYAGVYYAARAGYDVSGVADVWRRMASRNPASIHLAGTTHPSSAIRFVAIEQTAAEIADKQSRGLRLVPNLAAPS